MARVTREAKKLTNELRPQASLTIRLRVAAGANSDEIRGEHDGRIKVAVRAAPERGKANRAVLKVLGRVLGVPVKDLQVVGGELSRDKEVEVRNVEPESIEKKLGELLREQKEKKEKK